MENLKYSCINNFFFVAKSLNFRFNMSIMFLDTDSQYEYHVS